ncbi:response regulator [Bacillus sp. Marseille-P3661]|uniref:response regulator n=1 Tax=Bacillus sp. Marseille-P3661 TaxID=1936234 RepID=UPI000C84C3AE|nr:response regulator [Bacillus sp. Marseille-P3661]
MYKLLILDDEPIILDGLKHILDWKEYGFELAGTATDGVQGLLKIKELKPNLIITDIKMKFMDGLTFINEAKKLDPNLFFVVISAYSNFDYAKQSISLGVNNYLLKPINRSELQDVLYAVSEELDNYYSIKRREKHLQDTILANQQAQIERFIRNIFHGLSNDNEIEKIKIQKDFPLKNSYRYAVVLFKVNQPSIKNVIEQNNHSVDFINTYALRRILEESMCPALNNFVVDIGRSLLGVLVWDYTFNTSESMQLENALKEIQGNIKTYLNQTVSIARGRVYTGLKGIEYSYLDATHALEYSLLFGNNIYVDSQELETLDQEPPTYPKKIEDKIIEAIHFLDLIELNKNLHEFINQLRKTKSYIFSVTSLYQLFNAIIREVGDLHILERYGDVQGFIKEMHQKTTDEVMDTIYFLCNEYINDKLKKDIPSLKKMVRETVEFIKNNLSNPNLSVRLVADHFNMNTTYFGQIFKKDLGKSFNEYVASLRVEEAKRILSSQECKVYAVADQVGFKNTHYFNVVFKKMTGMTPNEYRNRM